MAYERYFGGRVEEYRRQELKLLVKNCITRGVMIMSMSLTPVLAAVCEYAALKSHRLCLPRLAADPFSFGLLSSVFHHVCSRRPRPIALDYLRCPCRVQQHPDASLCGASHVRLLLLCPARIADPAPLFVLQLPYSFQTCSDAYVALIRISKAMLAQEIDHPVPVRPDAPFAISAHADYGWETVGPAGMDAEAGGDKGAATEAQDRPNPAEPVAPFQLRDINIDIPRGALVVICGKVGSGKSSLVQIGRAHV